MVNNQINYAYEVYVGKKSDRENLAFVYRGVTLDETVAFALGFFRSSNVPDFCVVVYSIVSQSDILTFTK